MKNTNLSYFEGNNKGLPTSKAYYASFKLG